MIRAAAVLALALAAIPATLQAEDVWESQARDRMTAVATMAATLGYSMTPQYYYGRLRSGRGESIDLNLSASQQYVIVAVCDADCGDVDLSLSESDGRVVGSDLARDALPVIQVATGHSGAHSVRVSMARCSVDPCRYEIAVFSR